MTAKDNADPPFVPNQIVTEDHEIVLNEASAAPFAPARIITDDPDISLPEASATAVLPPTRTKPAARTTTTTTTHTTVVLPRTQATTTTTTSYTVAPPPYQQGRVPGSFGREPCTTTCVNCHQQIRTRVRHTADGCTLVAVVVLVLLCWPLFWLPLVIPGCKSSEHFCTNCNYRLSKEDACS